MGLTVWTPAARLDDVDEDTFEDAFNAALPEGASVTNVEHSTIDGVDYVRAEFSPAPPTR